MSLLFSCRSSCAPGENSIILGSAVGHASNRWNGLSISQEDSIDSENSTSGKPGIARRFNKFKIRRSPSPNQTAPTPSQTQYQTNVNPTFVEEGTSDV